MTVTGVTDCAILDILSTLITPFGLPDPATLASSPRNQAVGGLLSEPELP
jgi:hypothetical protein